MSFKLPFRYLEPTFYAGLLDDPILIIRIRPWGKSLMVDCGQNYQVAKRVFKSVTAVFISHAHMDHFMGMDKFARSVLVSPKTIDLFGPPGISAKLAMRLQGYDWNLVESNYCTFQAHDVYPDYLDHYQLAGAHGFSSSEIGKSPLEGREIYRNRFLKAESVICDHKIPVLCFKFTERGAFIIDEEKIEKKGLVKGEWLKELKRQFYNEELGKKPLKILQRQGEKQRETVIERTDLLFEEITKETPPLSIGYISDIGFSLENQEKVFSLMKGVNLLFCECTYLKEDQAKARKSGHLCTDDVNRIVDEIKPQFLVPMHLSKTYMNESSRLFEELKIPTDCSLIRLPERITPEPLLPCQVDLLKSFI